MRNIITTTFIILFLVGSLTAQDFHITGMTTDLPDGTLVSLKNMDVKSPIDTTYIEGNKFEFKGNINEGHNKFVLLLPKMKRTRPAFFFVENTDINIDLRNKIYVNDAVITGGRIQNQQAELVAILSKLKQEYDSLDSLLRTEVDPDLRMVFFKNVAIFIIKWRLKK